MIPCHLVLTPFSALAQTQREKSAYPIKTATTQGNKVVQLCGVFYFKNERGILYLHLLIRVQRSMREVLPVEVGSAAENMLTAAVTEAEGKMLFVEKAPR